MTVVRLSDASLILHSPCRPLDDLVRKIGRLGAVSHVVAPNWFHDLYLKQYRELYPQAKFWGPRFLRTQQPSLIDTVLDGAVQPPWFEEMPHITLSGLISLDESIFFHANTRTLLAADFLTNAIASARAPLLTRMGYRFLRLDGRLQIFPYLRWFGFSSRASIASAVRQIFTWNPERLIVGHGKPLEADVNEQLRAAFRSVTK